MRGVTLAAGIAIALACGPPGAKERAPGAGAPITVVRDGRGCLRRPPPARTGNGKEPRDPLPGMPAEVAGWFTFDGLRAAVIYWGALQSYAEEAWIKCGPVGAEVAP